MLRNGRFADGMAHWFAQARAYFVPWHIDNLYLELLIETGLSGLLLFVALLLAVIWRVWRAYLGGDPLAAYPLASILAPLLALGLVVSVLDMCAWRRCSVFSWRGRGALGEASRHRQRRGLPDDQPADGCRGRAPQEGRGGIMTHWRCGLERRARCLVALAFVFGVALAGIGAAAETGRRVPSDTRRSNAPGGNDGERVVATLRVGPTRAIRTLGEAARRARDGEVIEIDAGEYRAPSAVWTQNDLLIRGLRDPRGMAPRVVLIADGASAEGKAIWVVRGGRVRIEDIEFRGARVASGNGAGDTLQPW